VITETKGTTNRN